jgi:hypothetical protein
VATSLFTLRICSTYNIGLKIIKKFAFFRGTIFLHAKNISFLLCIPHMV